MGTAISLKFVNNDCTGCFDGCFTGMGECCRRSKKKKKRLPKSSRPPPIKDKTPQPLSSDENSSASDDEESEDKEDDKEESDTQSPLKSKRKIPPGNLKKSSSAPSKSSSSRAGRDLISISGNKGDGPNIGNKTTNNYGISPHNMNVGRDVIVAQGCVGSINPVVGSCISGTDKTELHNHASQPITEEEVKRKWLDFE